MLWQNHVPGRAAYRIELISNTAPFLQQRQSFYSRATTQGQIERIRLHQSKETKHQPLVSIINTIKSPWLQLQKTKAQTQQKTNRHWSIHQFNIDDEVIYHRSYPFQSQLLRDCIRFYYQWCDWRWHQQYRRRRRYPISRYAQSSSRCNRCKYIMIVYRHMAYAYLIHSLIHYIFNFSPMYAYHRIEHSTVAYQTNALHSVVTSLQHLNQH